MGMTKKLREKWNEALQAVLPIIAIVLVLCFVIAPISSSILLCFLLGAVLLLAGMMLFTLGAELAMSPMGERVGTCLTKSRKLPVVIGLSFLLGFIITISEPDLQVLANQVPAVPNMTLILSVACGVGTFLVVALLRMLFSVALPPLLLVFYGVVFVLAMFVPKDFLSVAFDSGGVTTGPMTVPFILALGIGVSNIRSDKKAEADSFGLVALCSIGPIIAVMLLGLFYPAQSADTQITAAQYADTAHIGSTYLRSLPHTLLETAVSLLPIAAVFVIFNAFSLKLTKRSFARICFGIFYTYAGLVLFLTGVNVGFSPLGTVLGSELMNSRAAALAVPLAMVFGWFIISAEPAVAVLEKQIEEVSAGAIPGKAIKLSLSAAVCVAMGLSMIRVLTGISVLWFLLPGYAAALILSFFVPDIYTAIAFDSGGVASGPMTATFMLQFFIGASGATGGNILSDAFGVVALVAMVPLISIQAVGLIYKKREAVTEETREEYGDFDIVELWEVEEI